MSENDELEGAETEDNDVEAHGLKEVAVTGLSAAAMMVGAGDALAANAPEHASAASKQAAHSIDSKQAVFKGAAISKGSVSKESVNKGAAISKGSVSKESVNKGATFKANATDKWSVSKEAFDPSSRRGRDAS